ncbi:DUF7483 domain-containing protein [Rhizobium rhizoryzae]|uniref:DUF7483 domain-containing protein n=1 Tax=Rhizobium rhizoryzae TaxID=451876 RepID=UPI0028B1BF0F|nr:hypothetical protein [Rhizobium rhizoryzae]
MRPLIALLLLLVLPVAAHAACTNPTAEAGSIVFSDAAKAMQYCNGTDWINTGAVIHNAPQTGCTGPTARAGAVFYNGTLGVVQFCNGSSWVDTACARDRKPNGPGCNGKPGGTLQYVGSPINELQFCDSTNWIAMGYPCGPVIPLNVADVFSTDLYTGNGATQTITNGIDLAGNGGLVWSKSRANSYNHELVDTLRGASRRVYSDMTSQEFGSADLTAFGSQGFTLGNVSGNINSSGASVSWTFRKAPKFFDVVTYAGNGVVGRQIAHNLGALPGMLIVKRTNANYGWVVQHRSISASNVLLLNATQASTNYPSGFNSTAFTSTNFTLGTAVDTNEAGGTYVAYLFAHDPSPDGVIQCGSYTGNGSGTGPVVTLGWQPQWLFVKRSDATEDWYIWDTARSTANPRILTLSPNRSWAETSNVAYSMNFNATGFQPSIGHTAVNASGGTYIYCAIRAEGS